MNPTESLKMEYSDKDDEFSEKDIDFKSEETSCCMPEYIETERHYCVDIKENFDIHAIKCENSTIKHEIQHIYEYDIKKEHEDCIDRNDDLDFKVFKCEKLIIKPEIQDSARDNT